MKSFWISFLFFSLSVQLFSTNSILIKSEHDEITLNNNIYFYEDPTNNLNISRIKNITFEKVENNADKINLGHSKSSFWFKFNIKNISEDRLYYILGIDNPNLDEVDFYEFMEDVLIKEVKTGESLKRKTRDILHRLFLFRSHLKPDINYTYFIRVVNNGDELGIPLFYKKAEPFFTKDEKQVLILGLYNGLFLMITIFTFYLFVRLKDPVYLYYCLYVSLTTLFILGGDGLLSFLIPPYFAVRIKLTFIHLGMFFLIIFTQSFYKSSNEDSFHFPWYFNFLKIISITGAFLTFLPYPYRLSSIYIGTVTAPVIYITVVLVSIILYKKEYYTSFYSAAFFCSLFSVIIYILYDYGFFTNSLLTENSLKVGKSLEGILLTLAVVERFKYNENLDKLLIKERSEKIEAQKEILQSINQELEKLSIVANETDNAIAIFDSNFDIEWCNTAFERIYESSLYNLIQENGKNILELSNHDDIKIILNECIESKKSVRYQSKKKSKSDKDLWTQTTLTPFIDKNNEIIKLITVDTNITQLKEIQKELIQSRDKAEESDKLKSAFLSNISHELRTPLNAILGFSELLLLNNNTDETKRTKYLELVRNNGQHLLKLISDIIDISRIEAGEIKLDLFKGNINQLLNELYNHYKIEIETNLSKDLEIIYHFDLTDEQSEVFADHHKIRQVFTNLLNNALKFTLSGHIKLGYTIENKKFKFFVEDTGIGIEEDQKRIIFERFRQVELGLSRKYEGAGLGLTLSKGLIEKMGGKIWVNSEIGKGSTFYFYVPYEPIVVTEKDEEVVTYDIYDFKGKRILIVEDTVASRELITEMLEDSGVEIVQVENGKDALRESQNSNFDIILMDIRLPDVNGYDVTKTIRENNKNVCIIAQTANAMDDEKRKCFDAGCDDYIAKPFNSNDLLSLINKHLYKT